MRWLPEFDKSRWIIGLAAVLLFAAAIASAAYAADAAKDQASGPDLISRMEAEAANRQAADAEPAVKQEPVYITLLSFIFKLAVVVALAYGTIYALKRLNVGALKGNNSNIVKVVENASLGANRSLHIIEVGDKTLLISSTPSKINLLTEVDASAAGQAVADGSADETDKGGAFSGHLSKFMGNDTSADSLTQSVAGMIRGSSAFLQDKVLELGRLRKKFKNA
ncbi:MAG: flagellar biosynthetic protein FliO [Armatimonadetes bacterium]|nr:flagellar biosynthetic protein FliO [Armatimonadota bacterium]